MFFSMTWVSASSYQMNYFGPGPSLNSSTNSTAQQIFMDEKLCFCGDMWPCPMSSLLKIHVILLSFLQQLFEVNSLVSALASWKDALFMHLLRSHSEEPCKDWPRNNSWQTAQPSLSIMLMWFFYVTSIWTYLIHSQTQSSAFRITCTLTQLNCEGWKQKLNSTHII